MSDWLNFLCEHKRLLVDLLCRHFNPTPMLPTLRLVGIHLIRILVLVGRPGLIITAQTDLRNIINCC